MTEITLNTEQMNSLTLGKDIDVRIENEFGEKELLAVGRLASKVLPVEVTDYKYINGHLHAAIKPMQQFKE